MSEPEPDGWEEPPQTLGEKSDMLLADALAHGRIRCKRDLERLARTIQRPLYVVERKARSHKVKALMGEEIQYRALCHVAQRLDKIAKIADTKGWAWKALCQIATVIPVGGVSLTQNTLIDARVSGSTASVQASARQFWERVRQERGGLKLIDAIEVHDPPTDEPPPKDDPEPEGK